MISLLVPTRKRPQRLRELINSVIETSFNPQEILCYVADDDDSYDPSVFPEARFVNGPRLIMSDLWNALLPHAKGDIYMLCADDVLFRTYGWDLVVEAAFEAVPDKILLAFGDDGSPSGKIFSTLPFVHKRWVEVVGYFTGPGFSADFSDTWPFDVATMIERTKLLPIFTEHCHHAWGKAGKDLVYQENDARYKRDRPDLLYKQRLPERERDAEKLRKAIEEFQCGVR